MDISNCKKDNKTAGMAANIEPILGIKLKKNAMMPHNIA